MTPLLTVFSAPKPFTNPHIALIQENAINSWQQLGDDVEILLIGEEEGLVDAARKAGVRLISKVSRNRQGTPLVSSIFSLASGNSSSPLLAYVNADILLTHDFVKMANAVMHQVNEFLIVGRRWDLDITARLDFSGKWIDDLNKLIKTKARLHPTGGSDYFIFPREIYKKIPDMAIGRAGWDNWMIYMARRSGWHVVDASLTYKVVHQQHDYAHLPGGKPHYRLPESDENVRLAGGHHAIYTLEDTNWVLVDGVLKKSPLTWKKFWREIEICPALSLKSDFGARIMHAIFHPLRTYWEFRARMSEFLKRSKK
jgi:hypothetical protein